jgi:hypothetical protein
MESRRPVNSDVMPLGNLQIIVVNLFRLFGVLTLLFIVGILLTFVITAHLSPKPTAIAYARLSLFTLVGTLLGIGLLLLRKWAALIFSALSFALAVWSIIGSFVYWPFPEMLFILLLGLFFLIPLALTLFCWSHLKWRGKIPI